MSPEKLPWPKIAFYLLVLCVAFAALSGGIAVWQEPPAPWVPKTAATAGVIAVAILVLAGLSNLFFGVTASSNTKVTVTGELAQPAKSGSNIDEKRLERLDQHIKFEFELIAQRVTYLAISESFLFGTYATALAARKATPAPTDELLYATSLENLIHAVPWIGVVLAAVVFAAVLCAISMIFKLKEARCRLEGAHSGIHPDIGWRSLEHFVGLLPPLFICASFFIAWLCVWPSK